MKVMLIMHKGFLNGSGGTEKMCSFIANTFAAKGHEVVIGTSENTEGSAIFPLEKNVRVINFYCKDLRQIEMTPHPIRDNGSNLLKYLQFKLKRRKIKSINKKIIKDAGGEEGLFRTNLRLRSAEWKKNIDKISPDVLITMSISSLLEITFENKYECPIINSVNGRPDYDYSDILWQRSNIEKTLLENSYRYLTGIQVLFEDYKNFLPNTFKGIIRVIPNPTPQIDFSFPSKETNQTSGRIIHIGTLASSCKKQEIAIEIFNQLESLFPNWELHFFGTGADQEFLQNLINEKSLQKKVFLRGFTNDPISELKKADIFIFPSQYEGFPLALSEAMAVGLPSIGFAYCSGVNELILHGENGFLAQDENEMQEFLKSLMISPTLRAEIGNNAHLSMKKYDSDFISEQWIDFVETISKREMN